MRIRVHLPFQYRAYLSSGSSSLSRSSLVWHTHVAVLPKSHFLTNQAEPDMGLEDEQPETSCFKRRHYIYSNWIRNAKKQLRFFRFFFFFLLFRAARGSSPSRGPIGATAASLHHNHSNTGSLTLWATLGINQTHILMVPSQVRKPLSHEGNSLFHFLCTFIYKEQD